MIVAIGNHLFNSAKEPIMIRLFDEEKKTISEMKPENTVFASYPHGTDEEYMDKIMDAFKDDTAEIEGMYDDGH
jgi:hypothetical protein